MDTVQVNAFQTNLHGTRILCQGPFPSDRHPPLEEAISALRTPFKRRILLTNGVCTTGPYHAVLQIQEGLHGSPQPGGGDWSLALTYITHAPKPCLVVVDDVPIPSALWGRLPPSVTLVHRVTTPLASTAPYSTLFFAPIQDSTSAYAEQVLRTLQQRYKPAYSAKEFKEVVNELRVAGLGLVFSGGQLEWYEPVPESLDAGTWSKRQLAELFERLARQFH